MNDRDSLAIENPLLAEMFWNDFCVEWNKVQANHFIKTNELLDTGKTITLFPTIWISEWYTQVFNTLDNFNLNQKFDIRNLPFESFLKELDSLKVIFKNIFKATKKDFEASNNIKNHLLNWSFSEHSPDVLKENISRSIYLTAQIEFFPEMKENENDFNRTLIFLFCAYYGKQNKNNEGLFKTYRSKSNEEKELNLLKEKLLSFRGEDSKYWRYYLSIINENNFRKAFSDTFDIKSYGKEEVNGITNKVFKANSCLLLDEDLPKKTSSTFIHKKIKI